jgi:predicted phosphoribosyltransferase
LRVESAAYFRQRAERCRRLAASIFTLNDPTKVALLALSREFDVKAAAATAHQIRHGYTVPTTGGDGADTEPGYNQKTP